MEKLRCKCGTELVMDSNKPTLTCTACDFKYDIKIIMKHTADNGIDNNVKVDLSNAKITSKGKIWLEWMDEQEIKGIKYTNEDEMNKDFNRYYNEKAMN